MIDYKNKVGNYSGIKIISKLVPGPGWIINKQVFLNDKYLCADTKEYRLWQLAYELLNTDYETLVKTIYPFTKVVFDNKTKFWSLENCPYVCRRKSFQLCWRGAWNIISKKTLRILEK